MGRMTELGRRLAVSPVMDTTAFKRALKQHTRWTGVFSGFTGVRHFTCDLRCAAGAEELTVNVHAVHNFTVVLS